MEVERTSGEKKKAISNKAISNIEGASGPLASHRKELWHHSPHFSLMELDPKSGTILKRYPVPSAKTGFDGPYESAAMLSHKGFLYIIDYQQLYQVKTKTKDRKCDWKLLNDDKWEKTKLAAVTGDSSLYARCKGFFSDSIYKINPSKIGSSGYTKVGGGEYKGSTVITGHGRHLYTTGGGGHLWAIDTKDGSSTKITKTGLDGTVITRLYSYSLSVICSRESNSDPCVPEVVKVKPYWVQSKIKLN